MKDLSSVEMTANGQLAIPEEVRKALNLKKGARFVVLAFNDSILFKLIQAPSLQGFGELIEKERKAARKAGLTKADLKAAITKVRAEKRKKK